MALARLVHRLIGWEVGGNLMFDRRTWHSPVDIRHGAVPSERFTLPEGASEILNNQAVSSDNIEPTIRNHAQRLREIGNIQRRSRGVLAVPHGPNVIPDLDALTAGSAEC